MLKAETALSSLGEAGAEVTGGGYSRAGFLKALVTRFLCFKGRRLYSLPLLWSQGGVLPVSRAFSSS